MVGMRSPRGAAQLVESEQDIERRRFVVKLQGQVLSVHASRQEAENAQVGLRRWRRPAQLARLDISLARLDISLQVAATRGVKTALCNLEQTPYADGVFALVACTDVLEHVMDLNRVVWEMLRVLRPGGVLVIRTPDSEDLTGYLEPEYPYRFVHLRRFDAPGWRLLLDRVFGLEVLAVERVFGTALTSHAVARKPL